MSIRKDAGFPARDPDGRRSRRAPQETVGKGAVRQAVRRMMADSIGDDKTGLGVRFDDDDDDGGLLFTYSTVILVAEKE